MVEANIQISEEINAAIIKEIDAKFKNLLDAQEGLKEEFEELKSKVKPKILVAAKALADAENDFGTFQKKHEAGGKQVFTKTLKFY